MKRCKMGDVEQMERDNNSYILTDNREVIRFSYQYSQFSIDSYELENSKFNHLMHGRKLFESTWNTGDYKYYKNVNVE